MQPGPSPHPTDGLIRELIRTGRQASPDEIQQIIERMATAPFDARQQRIPVRHRGLHYLGRMLGVREESLVYHLVKRVLVEDQWAAGTTEADYLQDLRRAVLWPEAQLLVYHRAGESFAATASHVDAVIPSERRGADFLPWVLVIYSADRSALVTGYQFSTWEAVNLPEKALWLR